jgi:hypothetical protein
MLNDEQTLGRQHQSHIVRIWKKQCEKWVLGISYFQMENSPHSISEELLKELEAANKRFSEAKGHLEQAVDSNEFRHEETLEKRHAEFREAERGVEETTRKIEEAMKAPKSDLAGGAEKKI